MFKILRDGKIVQEVLVHKTIGWEREYEVRELVFDTQEKAEEVSKALNGKVIEIQEVELLAA